WPETGARGRRGRFGGDLNGGRLPDDGWLCAPGGGARFAGTDSRTDRRFAGGASDAAASDALAHEPGFTGGVGRGKGKGEAFGIQGGTTAPPEMISFMPSATVMSRNVIWSRGIIQRYPLV